MMLVLITGPSMRITRAFAEQHKLPQNSIMRYHTVLTTYHELNSLSSSQLEGTRIILVPGAYKDWAINDLLECARARGVKVEDLR